MARKKCNALKGLNCFKYSVYVVLVLGNQSFLFFYFFSASMVLTLNMLFVWFWFMCLLHLELPGSLFVRAVSLKAFSLAHQGLPTSIIKSKKS